MNPNFKHIVKKLKIGSHKGGSPFPRNGSKKDKEKNNTYAPFTSQEAYDAAQLSNYTGKGKGKGKSREQAYQDRDMNIYGDLNRSEYNAEIDRQNAGGKVPKTKMKGSGSKTGSGGKKLLDFIWNSQTPGFDKVNKRLNEEKNKKRIEEVTKKHYKDEADRKAKEAFDNKTIKDHRADKRATRNKFRGSGKTDADKLEKIRSLGESKRGIKNIKENKRIAKLAARKGISEEEATKLRGERKQKGRDFWRNFASQLTHGVNVAGKGNFDASGTNRDFLKESMDNASGKDNKTNNSTPEQIEKDTGNQLQYDSYINNLGYAVDHENINLKNAGQGLGSYNPKDYIPEWNTGSEESDYFNTWKKSESLLNKLSNDEGDSTPQTAMRKIYKQKRGY